MGPSSSNFHGPFDVLLSFDVGEILMIDRLLLKQRLDIAPRAWDRLRAIKKTNRLRQGRDSKDRHILDDGSLSGVLGWHDHALQPCLAAARSQAFTRCGGGRPRAGPRAG